MTDQNSNPFVLPGMGQGGGEAAGNPLLASMEMMRQAWAGLTGPGGLAQSLPMAPPMNVQDLERRIAELRAVESWLRMNLSMLSSTIQGMEVQRSTIATLRSFADSVGAQARDPAAWGDASPLEVVLGLKPAPGGKAGGAFGSPAGAAGGAGKTADRDVESGPAKGTRDFPGRATNAPWPASQPGVGKDSGGMPPDMRDRAPETGEMPGAGKTEAAAGGDAGSAHAISQAAQSASDAWWGMLQQQFNQLAAATAATMPGGAGGPSFTAQPAATGRKPATRPGKAEAADAPPDDTAAGTSPRGRASGSAAAGKTAVRKSTSAKTAPRKTAARKNKIQSGSNRA